MGKLIHLDRRRAERSPSWRDETPAFFFDLCCPHSYLTAERIERALGKIEWVPVPADALRIPRTFRQLETIRERADGRARALRLPLVSPEHPLTSAACALRAASLASELGAGSSFALAAMRLSFCGGFDLDDPESLAEAAAAAGLPLDACLDAAGDLDRDQSLEAAAELLRAHGVRDLPAIRIRGRWFEGDDGLASATAQLREPCVYDRPLAPSG